MIIAVVAWLGELFFCLLPKQHRSIALIPLVVAAATMAILSVAVVYAPDDYLVLNKDRSLYDSLLRDAASQSQLTGDFEFGYSLTQYAFAAISTDTGIFFALVAIVFLASVFWFLSTEHSPSEVAVLFFLVMNLFPFAQGALNVTRQFLSASIILMGYRSFHKLANANFRDVRALAVFVAVVALASLFHRSALMILLPIALLVAGLKFEQLIVLGVAAYALNLSGLGEPIWSPLVSNDMRVSEYVWQYQRGELGYQYSGGVNRVDFFVFSIVPLFTYLLPRYASSGASASHAPLYIFYLCLIYPFFTFSFIPFSERLLFYGWLIWPVVLCGWAVHSATPLARVYLFLCVTMIAAVALFKLFGVTATTFAIDYLM